MPRILLVEDNEFNRDMLSRRLKKQAFDVVVAVDGGEACVKARDEAPDLILMDLHLPILDGWEVTRRLKADDTTRNIPIIALTADAMSGDEDKALEAGCNDYETKPVDLPRLLNKIGRLLGHGANGMPHATTTHSDQAQFWDERFRREGLIWGEAPSPTATTALRYLSPKARVLEIGFGYGRDLAFLLRHGFRVSGVDLSTTARHFAEARLSREVLVADRLVTASFEDNGFPDGGFDGVVSHRMAHLLVTDAAVERFAETIGRVLRPGGILCLAVRNAEDRNPSEVRHLNGNVYEYAPRPGHWIRFWDDDALRQAFGKAFTFLTLDRVTEEESGSRPVPCCLTVLVARRL